MYTDFNHFLYCHNRNVWRIKVKLRLPLHHYSVTPLPSKAHTTANIDVLFSNVWHFKVYPKQFSSTYSILAYFYVPCMYVVCHARTPCWSRWREWDAIWQGHLYGGPKEHCVRQVPRSPTGRGDLGGRNPHAPVRSDAVYRHITLTLVAAVI